MISTSFNVKCKSRKYRMPEMTCVQNNVNREYWVKKKLTENRKFALRLYHQMNTSSGSITPSLLRSQCSKEVWDWSSSIEWWYTSLFSSLPFSAKWRRRVVSVSLKKPGISANTEEMICSFPRTFASQRIPSVSAENTAECGLRAVVVISNLVNAGDFFERTAKKNPKSLQGVGFLPQKQQL